MKPQLKKITIAINSRLYDFFINQCKKDGVVPAKVIESWIENLKDLVEHNFGKDFIKQFTREVREEYLNQELEDLDEDHNYKE
jgi:hypothetical protein